MQEEWRPVIGFEGYYEVSNVGRVRSLDRTIIRSASRTRKEYAARLKGKVLKQARNTHGYSIVSLRKNATVKSVHRLVAEAFIEKEPGKDLINHIDGNKSNNKTDNLEWCTNKENQLHAMRCLGAKPGSYQNKPVRCVENGEVFENSLKAAKGVRYIAGNIRMAANPKYPRKTCMGYHWEFVDKN